jgi:type III restriction enzyme
LALKIKKVLWPDVMQFAPKNYQTESLDRLTEYARKVRELAVRGANRPEREAFEDLTGRGYYGAPGFHGVPYVCLRIPTGGGKTILAAEAVGKIGKDLLHTDRPACLWITPSTTIRDQTLRALKNVHHPYRAALDQSLDTDAVEVATLEEAIQSSQLVGGSTPLVLVTTIQSYRIRDESDGEELASTRRIYRDNGYMQTLFDNVPAEMRGELVADADGLIQLSLANALRLRRPIVIMDEAHNARTPVSFESLARFGPSFVLELTATPELQHDPQHPTNPKFASNVLHSVSAVALKREGMIKLPVYLESRTDWLEVLAATKQRREELEKIADHATQDHGLPFIRPIALIQAQAHSRTRETHTVEAVKKALLERFPNDIIEDQVKICTGSIDEIGDMDLMAENCPVRYVITVDKLREGWDCPFAYVLGSIGNTATATAVEQLLGRVMRMPFANPTGVPALDCSYAFVLSENIQQTANQLRDKLVETCGFDDRSAADALRVQADLRVGLGLARMPVVVPPAMDSLPATLVNRVRYEAESRSLVFTDLPTAGEARLLRDSLADERDRRALDEFWDRERPFGTTTEPLTQVARPLLVPRLALRVNNRLSLLEPTELDEFSWDLNGCNAALSEQDFSSEVRVGSAATIDLEANRTGDDGALVSRPAGEVRLRQLELIGEGDDWSELELVRWLDNELHRDDTFIGLPLAESQSWIRRVVNGILARPGATLPVVVRRRHPLAQLIRTIVSDHGRAQSRLTTERLFQESPDLLAVSNEFAVMIEEQAYLPPRLLDRGHSFDRHAFSVVANMGGEELECAMRIDIHPNVARWIRNTEHVAHGGFSLPLSPGNFFPDFIVELRDGRIVLVEYKGGRWAVHPDETHKKRIGELWEARSNGRCRFAWVVDCDWSELQRQLRD